MRYLLIVIIFYCSATSYAQPLDPTKELSQYNVDHWQDEATPSSIMQIIQAQDGYLWMSTLKGLVRFDGLKLNVYDKFTNAALDVNGFKSLHEDKNGNFWVGSIGEGLYLKQHQTFKKFTVPFGTSSNNIERIFTDSHGVLWLCTVKGIIQYRDSTFTLIKPESISEDSDFPTFDIAESTDGTLWVGSAAGLYKINNNKLERAFESAQSLVGEIVDLHIDSTGSLWVAGYNNGFFRIKDNKVERIAALDQLKHPIVIYEDSNHNLWFGSEHGIARKSAKGFSYLTSARGLSHDHITAICEDHEGSIWLGSYYGGINRLRDGTFTNYSTANGLPHETTHVLLERSDKSIWAGTETDLAYLKEGHFQKLSDEYPVLSKARVRDLMEDRDNNLWIASYDGAFKISKNKSITKHHVGNGLSNNQARVLYEDRNNNIWIGTRQGLNLLRENKWLTFGPKEGLLNDFIMSILELRNGKFLVGTTGGLYILKGDTFEPVTTDHGNLTLTIFRMFEDESEHLWIGTSNGLIMLDGNTLTDYSHHDKILSSNVYQILQDENGFLWLTSDLGIARIEKGKLVSRQLHDTTKLEIRLFDKSSGLRTSAITPTSRAIKTTDGHIWFATLDGVASIDPKNIRINKTPPPIIVEKILVGGKEYSGKGETINIRPGTKNIEIHYTGLSFMIPKKVRFRYMLKGYDNGWQDVGERRIAYYTSLPPGNYSFTIAASNNDGVWNVQENALHIFVERAFWQTPWFIVVSVISIAVTIAGAINWRTRRIRRHNELLEEKIRERTQEVIVQKEEIESQRDYIEAKNTELEKAHELIARQNHELREANENLEDRIERRTNALKKANADLTEANSELDHFVYKSAHDIKGPLARLQGLCNLAVMEAQLSPSKPYLLKLQHESELANRVIQKLSHAHAVKNHEVKTSSINLSAVLGNIIKELTTFHAADTKDPIKYNIDIEESIDLVTDGTLLKEILYHLVENAIVFRANYDPKIDIITHKRNDVVVITVRDNGIGIDEQIVPDVFKMFVKGSEKSQGLGLGLYIVKKGLEKLQGAVALIRSEEGATEFQVTLPLRTNVDEQKVKREAPTSLDAV